MSFSLMTCLYDNKISITENTTFISLPTHPNFAHAMITSTTFLLVISHTASIALH